jgi:hypothetical protein
MSAKAVGSLTLHPFYNLRLLEKMIAHLLLISLMCRRAALWHALKSVVVVVVVVVGCVFDLDGSCCDCSFEISGFIC